MSRKPKHENQSTAANTIAPPAPALVPNILDAFKNPAPPSSPVEPVTSAPTLSNESGERVQKILSDASAAMHDPEPAQPTPPLPRAVEVLFNIALEVDEKEKTSISTRLDAAAELLGWLDRLGGARTIYDIPRVSALRVFLEHVVEYKVRCEPKERVRAAGLLLKMG